jgi:hypothetical protein
LEDGKLSEVFLDVTVQRSDDVELNSRVLVTQALLIGPDTAHYFVHQPHVTGPPTEASEVNITPEANSEERQKAFDFDMGCLTAFRQCAHVCQLSPSAGRDLGEQQGFRIDEYGDVAATECEKMSAGSK